MNKLHLVLAGVFAAQMLLAGLLYWQGQNGQAQSQAEPLLSFAAAEVDRVVIADGDQSLTLHKQDGQWQLPDLQQLPGAADKMDELLERLTAIQLTWPVATTTGAHTRFEVADEKFQRRIEVFSGDKKQGEFFLGTSPGFRKVHARRAGESEVFAVNLNTFDLPVAANEWLDKSLIAATNPQSISGVDYTLQKSGDAWTLAEPTAEGEQAVNEQQANNLAKALTGLRVQTLASDLPDTEAVVIAVKDDKAEWRYEFMQADNNYYVKRSDKEAVFTISQSDYERITGVRQPQLALKEKEEKGEASDQNG